MSALSWTIDLLFPPRCANCKTVLAGNRALCDKCRSLVRLNSSYFCAGCGARLPDARKVCHPKEQYILAAAADYDSEPVKSLIHGLKFDLVRDCASELGVLLREYAAGLPSFPPNPFLIPIPLGKKRFKERGFNQAELITRSIGWDFAGLETEVLIRTKETSKQTDLENYDLRTANVSDAFAVLQPEKINGREIILVDDVSTSGATLSAAAAALKSAGAKKVIGLVAARARR